MNSTNNIDIILKNLEGDFNDIRNILRRSRFYKIKDKLKYVLVSNLQGIYGFPKGHMEAGESEEETALREVFEETNLRVVLQKGFRTTDEHGIPGKVDTIKKIVYFLGYFDNQNIVYRKEELSGAYLVDFEEAMQMFQYESSRRILKEANDYLMNLAKN